MNLFDATGIILIAVDDKFTLDDPDGIEVQRDSIHRQFLIKYYTAESGHKSAIDNAVAERDGSSEVTITIGDKSFVLFAYTTQGNRTDYNTNIEYRRGLIEIEGSLKKALVYCKVRFPGETVHTALIGTGVQNDRTDGLAYSERDAENRIINLSKSVGVSVEIIM